MNSQESKKLEQRVIRILSKYIKPRDTIIAGISGGPDSIFLLHFLKQIPCKIITAHIDHKLRKESKKDADFVKAQSKNFHLKTCNIKSLAKKSKKGLEEAGRIVRYQFFNQLAKKYKAKYILTAHHADDNLETMIFNFSRGASLQGLAGITEVEGNLLRPLLSFSKKEIVDYLGIKKIPFLKDETNEDKTYHRNFIRHEIIPKLKKINPNIVKTTAKNSQNLRSTNDFLASSAQSWLDKNQAQKLDAKSFRKNPETLQKLILLEIYKKITGSTRNIESTHLDEVIELIKKGSGNKEKKLGKLTVRLKNNLIELV